MVTAIYRRVSTTKQEEFGVSLKTQQEKLQAYCTIKNFENVKEYMDVGTGRNVERPDFQRMLLDIECGKIKNVVVLKLDRLTRSISDLDKLLRTFEAHGCSLHSATESLDTSTANGRMMVNIIGVFAQWESETISERVSVNMQSLSEKGVWMSAIPFGFDLGEDKRLIINEKEAAILREAFQLVLQGDSFTSAERKIVNKYNLDWHRNYLSRKIRHASTSGDIERNGKIIYDTHEGIVTKEEKTKLIEIMESNLTGRTFTEYTDVFRRRIECPNCGKVLSLAARKKSNGSHYHSYACNACHHAGNEFMSVSEKKMMKSFMEYMSSFTFEGKTEHAPEQDERKTEITEIKKRIKAIEAKKDKIQRAWLGDLITDVDLAEYKKEFDADLLAAEEELAKLSVEEVTIDKEEMEQMVKLFNTHFETLETLEKRQFVQEHVRRIQFKRELEKGYKKMYRVEVTNVEFF